MQMQPSDAEEFIREANEIDAMTATQGWAIIKRDICEYIHHANKHWMNMRPNEIQFEELRVRTMAAHMLLQIVSDYKVNRKKMMDFYLTTKFPEYFVPFDVDNEYPLKEE